MGSAGQIVCSILKGTMKVVYVIGLLALLFIFSVAVYAIGHIGYMEFIGQLFNQPFESMTSTFNKLNLAIIVFGVIAAIFQHKISLKVVSRLIGFDSTSILHCLLTIC